ncbi:hypothetical protein [Aestuariibius sp. HNIBRBA575]|uniref:hypothetical protein n=1 Tax=Aestuariibius sp. HNIBRBA575 TaxID=3233343 RepID=UPI0034A50C28
MSDLASMQPDRSAHSWDGHHGSRRNPWGRAIVHWTILTTILLLFYSKALATFVPVFGFVDELVLLVALMLLPHSLLSKTSQNGLRLLAIVIFATAMWFMLASFIWGDGRLASGRAVFYTILGSFVHVKLFLFCWLGLFLVHFSFVRISGRFITFLIVTMMVGFAFNHLAESTFLATFPIELSERFGTKRIVGFHLTNVAGPTFFALFLISRLADSVQKHGRLPLTHFTTATVLVLYIFVISTTRSAIISYFIGVMLVVIGTQSGRWLIVGLSAITAILSMFAGNLGLQDIEIIQSGQSMLRGLFVEPDIRISRSIMMYYGSQLALDHFPVGIGVANYASPYAEHSPIYNQLGLSGLIYIQAYNGVIDSNLASIFGELGYLGLALIITNLALLWRVALKNTTGAGMFISYIALIIVMNSVTSPVFFKGDWCVTFAILLMKFWQGRSRQPNSEWNKPHAS